MMHDGAQNRSARALVIGESLIDVIVDGAARHERPGGSPMNLSIGLARQGVDVAFVTSLGADHQAEAIEHRLITDGVDVYTPMRAGRTSLAIATLDAGGAASFDFDLTWSLEGTQLPDGVPDVVHFGSLGAALDPGVRDVDALVERFRPGALVSYDPNIRPRLEPDLAVARARVDRHAALADIVKASDEDIANLHPEVLGGAEGELREALLQSLVESTIDRWLAAGCALVVITRAERAVEIATPAHRMLLPGSHPEVVDTIGGGDAFMAGLLAGIDSVGLLRGEHRDAIAALDAATLRRIGAWAQRTAEITVTRVGAEPPTSLELLQSLTGQATVGQGAPASPARAAVA